MEKISVYLSGIFPKDIIRNVFEKYFEEYTVKLSELVALLNKGEDEIMVILHKQELEDLYITNDIWDSALTTSKKYWVCPCCHRLTYDTLSFLLKKNHDPDYDPDYDDDICGGENNILICGNCDPKEMGYVIKSTEPCGVKDCHACEYGSYSVNDKDKMCKIVM